jgi:hypothetical protein
MRRRPNVGISILLAVALAASVGCDPLEQAPPSFPPGEWVPLFKAGSLDGWRVGDADDFERHGGVRAEEGRIVLEAGEPQTGIAYAGAPPRDGYEIELEAARLEGGDFFLGLTFPVGESHCTLIAGGWGGGVVGLSNIDHMAAVENETTSGRGFETGRWYAFRLRVTPERIEAWIDGESIVDVERAGKSFSIWWQQEPMRPLGLAAFRTKAAYRGMRLRRL